MRFLFQSSDGSRSNSVTEIIGQMSGKRSKKTGMSTMQTADDFILSMPNATVPPRPTRRSTFADFFRGWGNSRLSNKARYKASRVVRITNNAQVDRTNAVIWQIKPPSPRGRTQMKSFDIDEALIERVMGKPKNAKQASENFIIQQKIRARSRSRTRGANSTEEPRTNGPRGRSMPLTTEEAQHMFVGAPYFNVSKTKTGYRAQVVFVDNKSKVHAPASTDHEGFAHTSFEASTLATESLKRDVKAAFASSRTALLEVPGMASYNGHEKGTTTFENFLQLAVSDSMTNAADNFRCSNRQSLYESPEKLGLRAVNTNANIERLARLNSLHEDQQTDESILAKTTELSISKMGQSLFGELLTAVPDASPSSTSLRTQIEALQRVLAEKELWHDFSLPQSRLRLGQLLWAAGVDHGGRPSFSEKELEPSEREVMLLQITLAAELSVRLAIVRAVSSIRGRAPAFLSEPDRIAIESTRTVKVNWDLVLAERFLETLEISSRMPTRSNRNGLFSTISHLLHRDGTEPFYQPKNQEQQISGLLHFAEMLQWPDTDELEREIVAKLLRSAEEQAASVPRDDDSIYATPLQSPWSGFSGRTDYLSANDKAQKFLGMRRASRPASARSELSHDDLFHPETPNRVHLYRSIGEEQRGQEVHVGGWLSRSWLSGLVMPGEAACHFLITTLLENTPAAVDALGDVADLRGGFIYQGRSYWSKAAIVGRVMAASKNARECMGWISIPGAPLGHKEGWVQLDTQDMPNGDASAARITEADAIARDSDPMGSGERLTLQQSDFISPDDGLSVMGNEVRSYGLSFTKLEGEEESYEASVTFASPINSKLAVLEVALTYDVQFVSAYPCRPEARKPKAPSNAKPKPKPKPAPEEFYGDCMPSDFINNEPEISDKEEDVETTAAHVRDEQAAPPCHALHIDYKFETMPVAVLLSAPPEQRPRALAAPADRMAYPADEQESVVVLDCRGAEDLQLLARAWCAKIGENAIVSKMGRTCLACSIREARALGIYVVIRI